MTLFEGNPLLMRRKNYNRAYSEYLYKLMVGIPIIYDRLVVVPFDVWNNKTAIRESEYIAQTIKN